MSIHVDNFIVNIEFGSFVYKLNCNCYITKPADLEQFISVVRSIEHFWMTIVTLPPRPEDV